MSDKQYYPGSYYQPLFDLMHQEHGLTLLESQMADIIHLVNKHYVSQVNPSTGMPSLDKPILTDEDVRVWEISEAPPIELERIPFDPNRLKAMEGHEERAEKSWEEIQKRLAQPPAVKGAVWVRASAPPGVTKYYVVKCEYKRWASLVYIDSNRVLERTAKDLGVEISMLEYLDESPTAAGGTIQIDYDWLALALADFATTYHASKNKDLMNDVAEFLSDRLKGKGVEYVLDENERATAAGDGKEGQELLDWIYENDIIRTEDGIWEKWDNGKALYRLFASGIDELYDIFKQQNK